jgi:hypothetical protein
MDRARQGTPKRFQHSSTNVHIFCGPFLHGRVERAKIQRPWQHTAASTCHVDDVDDVDDVYDVAKHMISQSGVK